MVPPSGSAMLPPAVEARALVEKLELQPHPEGGWFRRTWTSPDAEPGRRGSASSIQYLIDSGGPSRWHRIDASEIWTHVAGASVVLTQYCDRVGHSCQVLDRELGEEGVLSCVVDPFVWQSARTAGEWSLVVCVVVPEFRLEGFELAPDGWQPPPPAPIGGAGRDTNSE